MEMSQLCSDALYVASQTTPDQLKNLLIRFEKEQLSGQPISAGASPSASSFQTPTASPTRAKASQLAPPKTPQSRPAIAAAVRVGPAWHIANPSPPSPRRFSRRIRRRTFLPGTARAGIGRMPDMGQRRHEQA
ncbi:unnamed protein product [Vitrella brassicaformis CCMP3155]|uniref:Uncharacterized protein n=2 Tax=Vitrella brassicaformis TaxID=1169539 RepID=A0A0G4FR73_VITBC|nr:unnamed protein product [Vitrella brassicaformis CCMP3155]|eukprot:CEM16736.1 unnamed protein product [Vitrella brassicaformis CCMP3155]